ncbi:MAG: nucleotidyltransferase domain-containing protein [Dokdonella sp.]|nr:nucleotidyltransferase domain-containing protein [Dokdonella sp.]
MSNSMPLMDLLFPAARQKVLACLLLRSDESFHLRELARLTGSHAGTLGRELEKLTNAGLLVRKEQGNQVRYQADRGNSLFEDLVSMFRKTHGIVQVLFEALSPLSERIELAWVFGSMARGTPSAGSDVDLIVLSDKVGFAELATVLHPLHAVLRREINPVLYARDEFLSRLRKGDAFAKDLLEKPKLFVLGDKDDLAKLVGDKTAAGT